MSKKLNKHICYILLILACINALATTYTGECDIWFMFSHGRYVLSNGFPHTDFLTMHSNLHFVMQQWISSVVFYLSYKYLGTLGVYFLVWICNSIIIFLLYKLCMKISNNMLFSSFITYITSTILSFAFITCRPIIFSLIIILLLLYIMESFYKKESNITYYLIPLSLFQINIHASMWPILFILLLPYVTHYFFLYIKEKNKAVFKLLLIIVIMILIGYINPYGIENMIYSFKSYGVSDINNTIWEMNGLNLNSDLAYVKFFSYMVLLIMIGVSYIFIRSKKKIEIYRLLLFYGTLYMALLNIRNIPLFLICSLPFCSAYIDYKAKYENSINLKYKLLYILSFIILLSFIYINRNNYVLSDEFLGQKNVLEYMQKHNISKKEPIYTINTNGGYYSYNGYKTYIDTRAELFIKANNHQADIFHEFYLLMNGKIDYEKFLQKYNFKHLIINKKEPLNSYLKSDLNKNYQLIYKSKHTLLYEKKN